MNVENVRIQSFPVELDGQTIEICYDLNAFAELELAYGSVEKAVDAMETGSFVAIRTFLWAGAIRSRPDLSPSAVGALIAPKHLQTAGEVIGKALKAASPQQPKQPANAVIPNHVAAKVR